MTSASPSMKTKSLALPSVLRTLFTALVAIVFLTAFHRRYWTDSHDPFKCSVVLNEGRWLDALESNPRKKPWQIWQPPGCLLRNYEAQDVAHCAGTRQMLFAGDSNVRQLFWAVAKKLDYEAAIEARNWASSHDNIQFNHRDVDLRFVWDPYLNGSILDNELQIYRDNIASTGHTATRGEREPPAVMIVIGGGMWYARQFEAGAARQFKVALDKITTLTQRPDGSAWKSVSPFSGFEGIGDQVFMLPVEEPIYDKLSPARKNTIMPEEINQMNEYLHTLSPSDGLNVPWTFPVMTWKRRWAYEESGLHVIESIANRRADVLLNLRCNGKVDNASGAPYERTCCSQYTSGNWFQWVLVLLALLILPLAVVWTSSHTSVAYRSIAAIIAPLAIIAAALCYSFFADRTQLFGKVHKLYNQSEFLSLCYLSLLVGVASIRKTKDSLLRKDSNDILAPTCQRFLNKAQTDEWKGWMQAIVLIYHWTGASEELWIYIVVRLLVGSYLFLTGYGHATYFYECGDYSIRRVAAVLIRLNFLAVALSYQMYTNYLFYYFAPLVSFWFLVIWATFRFGRELNDNVQFLLGKIAVAATITMLAHSQAAPVDFIFMLIRHMFGMNWDADEWRFIVSLDGLVVYLGVLVALLHIWIRSVQTSPKFHQENHLSSLLTTLFPLLRVAAIIASLIILPAFFLLANRSPDKYDYNWWQPTISILPILSFVVLRNATGALRSYHSVALAWLGRCSLETFTLQFHIWTAADARGLLTLGVFAGDGTLRHDRWREFVLLTPLFLWVSWQVSTATVAIAAWFTEEAAEAGGLLPVQAAKLKEEYLAPRVVRRRVWGDVGLRIGVLLGALWILNLVTG